MDSIFEVMLKEVPSLAVMVILVWLFLKHMETTRHALISAMSDMAGIIKENNLVLREVSETLGRSKELLEFMDRRHIAKGLHDEQQQ